MDIDDTSWDIINGMIAKAHATLNNSAAMALLGLVPILAWVFGFVTPWWILTSIVCFYMTYSILKDHFLLRNIINAIEGFMKVYKEVPSSFHSRIDTIIVNGLSRMSNGMSAIDSANRCEKELKELMMEVTENVNV